MQILPTEVLPPSIIPIASDDIESSQLIQTLVQIKLKRKEEVLLELKKNAISMRKVCVSVIFLIP